MVTETINVDKIVLGESIEQRQDDVLGNLLANARHGAGRIDQDEEILRAGRCLQIPWAQSAVEHIWLHLVLFPLGGYTPRRYTSGTNKSGNKTKQR